MRFLAVLPVLFSFLLGVQAWAEVIPARPPVRVALQLETPGGLNARQMLASAVGGWLRERAGGCGSLRLVSAERNNAILGQLFSPAAPLPVGQVLAAYRQFQPLDFYVCYDLVGDQVEVSVYGDAGVRQAAFPARLKTRKERGSFQPFQDLAGLTRQVAGFIAENLPISDQERQALTEVRQADAEIAGILLASRAYPLTELKYGDPPPTSKYAEMRLRLLKPAWDKAPRDPQVAAQVLAGALELFAADPEVRRETYLVDWTRMAVESLAGGLGGPGELAAIGIGRIVPQRFARPALEMARPLLSPVDALEADGAFAGGGGRLEGLGQELLEKQDKFAALSRGQRLGAIRLLGIVKPPETAGLLKSGLAGNEPDVRAAAAFAAAQLPRAEALKLLNPLRQDKEPRVRFWALLATEKPDRQEPELLRLAGQLWTEAFPLADVASGLVAARGGQAEAGILQAMVSGNSPYRAAAAAALVRLGALPPAGLQAMLDDPEAAVVRAVLAELSPAAAALPREHLMRLVNDPYQPLAEAARQVLGAEEHEDPWRKLELMLAVEHPYLRGRILERLATAPEPEARRLLAEACANRDPQTRAKALRLLAGVDPAAAREPCLKLLRDEHFWVRFHACVTAAAVAAPEMADALRQAVAAETDAASKSWLEEALAKAAGGAPPPLPPAARSIKGARNLAWNTSPAAYAATSPFDAYYCMGTNVNRFMLEAHRAGKIIFARANGISGSPANYVLDQKARDSFWIQLETELQPERLAIFDGVVYGEETMSIRIDPFWEDAWRLFCVDAGIDPKAVAGNMARLTPSQTRAWRHWAMARNIEGFNILYDYTKLRFGRLRPGLQVCTFVPGEKLPYPSSPAALKGWKFDVGGVYDYKGDNRIAAYSLIRRYRTIWPEREVIWLSLGIGGYEMNPVFHTQKVPDRPLLDRYGRSFADSLTAWLAGGDTGWFSTWLFMSTVKGSTKSMSRLRGVHLWVEDLGPQSKHLDRATNYVYRGIDLVREELPAAPVLAGLDPDLAPPLAPELDNLDEVLDDASTRQRQEKQEELNQEIEANRQILKDGFLYYQKYVYDCARIFASLPRLRQRHPALAVQTGINVWTTPRYNPPPVMPALDLLNAYDYLCDVNMLPLIGLESYRLLVIDRPEAVDDATIEAISNWLRTTPGLLVLNHGWPVSAEAGTPEDCDGRLENAWPWAAELTQEPLNNRKLPAGTDNSAGLELGGALAAAAFHGDSPDWKPLLQVQNQTLLGCWRRPGWAGAVVFNGVAERVSAYQNFLREKLNEVLAAIGSDYRLQGPALLALLDTAEFAAAASSLYYRETKDRVDFTGVDIMNGDPDPDAGGSQGSRSSLVLKNYRNRFVAGTPDLAAVAEQPFAHVAVEGDALVFESPGYVRVASRTGAVEVLPAPGVELPEIDSGKITEWLFYKPTPGILRHQRRPGFSITYLRSPGRVTVRPGKPAAGR